MKAILLLFDSLNRHLLSPYGCDWTLTPNFQRLAQHTILFDRCYVGSMPCMPARRELHTGRYNFLHRSWGPIEPFDDSVPEMLKQSGVYAHLISDHQHYWEDGGATYHTRYTSWECVRGQEGDPWKAQVRDPEIPRHLGQANRQDTVNRAWFQAGHDRPMTQVFDLADQFLRTNHDEDNWFLHIEPFDPHEPFFVPREYQSLYPDGYNGPLFDWPPYDHVTEPLAAAAHCKRQYAALLTMCDQYLGKILDRMDEWDMWKDTMLIVTTDHGFLLGEHGWWAKNRPPFYEELSHIPLFIWDPRSSLSGQRRKSLVQTIDLPATLLGFFGLPRPTDMQGHDLKLVLEADVPVRDAALFGMFGAHTCITDGSYTYYRADRPEAPLYDYTLLPLRQRARCAPAELWDMTLASPFSFTKGCSVLKIPARRDFYPCMSTAEGENHDLLFDIAADPAQQTPIHRPKTERRLLQRMAELMAENDAPQEQFARMGLTFPDY